MSSNAVSLDIPRKWLLAGIVSLLTLNIVLFQRVSELTAENDTWKNKVTMSIGEQLTIHEHALEGAGLGPDLARLQRANTRFRDLFSDTGGYKLIYHFAGTNCNRCLDMELRLFNEYRSRLRERNIDAIMVFSDFQETHFLSHLKQYRIQDVAVMDAESHLLKRFDYNRYPLIVFLGRDNRVLLANYSDYQDEQGTVTFYEKLGVYINTIAAQG